MYLLELMSFYVLNISLLVQVLILIPLSTSDVLVQILCHHMFCTLHLFSAYDAPVPFLFCL